MNKLNLLPLLVVFAGIAAFSTSCSDDVPKVTVVLDTTALSEADSIFITGNLPVLGEWNPGAVLMENENGKSTFTFTVPPSTDVELKFTLGSWAKEILLQGYFNRENVTFNVTKDTTFHLTAFSLNEENIESTAVGNVQILPVEDPLGVLPARKLHVYLPKTYQSHPEINYPVIYMADGQNLFDRKYSGFMGEWGIDEYLESDTASEVIVVGIENSENRGEEYMEIEKGKNFRDWVVNHIVPIIDSMYRTDVDMRFSGGSSAGGAYAFLMLGTGKFKGALCFSPVFYYKGDGLELDYITPMENNRPLPYSLYFDMGGKGVDTVLLEGAEKMKAYFEKNPKEACPPYKYLYFPEDDHNEAAWRRRFPAALEWMLANYRN